MKLPKGVTIAGLLLAIGGLFVDPATTPFLTTLLGDHAGAKVAAAGALLAALGRALLGGTKPQDPGLPPRW